MKWRRDRETRWECFKRWGNYVLGVLAVLLVFVFGYTLHVKQDCIDLCKEAGFESGQGNHHWCKCITYTPYEGEW